MQVRGVERRGRGGAGGRHVRGVRRGAGAAQALRRARLQPRGVVLVARRDAGAGRPARRRLRGQADAHGHLPEHARRAGADAPAGRPRRHARTAHHARRWVFW